MTKPFPPNMTAVTRLMQAGQLQEATQLIQSQLGGQSGPAADPGRDASLPDAGRMAMPDLSSLSGLLQKGLPGLGGATLPGARGVEEPLPGGASWTWHQHQACGLQRDYRLYLPSGLSQRPAAGLILLLHGCTQDPDDFARGTRMRAAAEAHDLILVVPAQPQAANMNRCWNWFEPRHVAESGGEAAFLADLSDRIGTEHGVEPLHRHVAGLSAGAAMAVTLGSQFPDRFGAVGCHSGLPHGAASDMGSAFAAMSQGGAATAPGVGCRLIVMHGTTDRTVSPRNGEAVEQQALRRQPGLIRRHAAAQLAERSVQIVRHRDTAGVVRIESWQIAGLGHAWSGGAPEGSHTAKGPDATQAMVNFFMV